MKCVLDDLERLIVWYADKLYSCPSPGKDLKETIRCAKFWLEELAEALGRCLEILEKPDGESVSRPTDTP